MGPVTGTLTYATPLANKRIAIITATLAATSDTITLSLASHGVRTIYWVGATIETGMDANFATLQVAFSGLVITVVSKNAAGGAATSFGDIRLAVICD
jgi:hypothetical protein